MFELFSSVEPPLAAHPSKLPTLSMVAIGRFASDANLYEGSSTGPGTPLRQAEDTASKPNAVLDQLEWLLQQAGYVEGEDYTRESLEQPTPMAELYPEFSGSAQQRNDPPIEYPFEPRQFTEYTFCTPWVTEVYWYHPNYLGSVDLVTDLSGHAHQFFMYTAWGEPMFENSSMSGGFDAPYRFNGKELDKETGLGYYGARYYQNRLSNWLSVDPLAAERSWLTPYNFVQNNPIELIDPDGKLDRRFKINIETGEQEVTNNAGDGGDEVDYVEYYNNKGQQIGQTESRKVTHSSGDYRLPVGETDVSYQSVPGTHNQVMAPGRRHTWSQGIELDNTIEGFFFGGIVGNAIIKGVVGCFAAKTSSNVLLNTSRQLQAKFKHAGDFGVVGNYSKANAGKFSSAINQHINSAGVQTINGTYRGQSVIHYLNPNTGINVISSPSGQFISGWKLNPAQLKNVLKHGGL
jgi:RHS repeat-associated protein